MKENRGGEIHHKSKGGRFRKIYEYGPDHVIKFPRNVIWKTYPRGLKIPFPAAPYTLLKFGSANVNEIDYKNYKVLIESIGEQFTPKTLLVNGKIIQERVRDYNNEYSLSMDEQIHKFGPIVNQHFWNKIEEIKNNLLKKKCYLLGVFYMGSNIMVKKINDTDWEPVIVDFKRVGSRSYLFQPNLLIGEQLKKKFMRQFDRFIRDFKPSSVR